MPRRNVKGLLQMKRVRRSKTGLAADPVAECPKKLARRDRLRTLKSAHECPGKGRGCPAIVGLDRLTLIERIAVEACNPLGHSRALTSALRDSYVAAFLGHSPRNRQQLEQDMVKTGAN